MIINLKKTANLLYNRSSTNCVVLNKQIKHDTAWFSVTLQCTKTMQNVLLQISVTSLCGKSG